MKKLLIAAMVAGSAIFAQAASVGWSIACGSTAYAGDAYAMFVIGQKGVTSVDQITTLLASADASKYTDYAFYSGNLGSSASTMVNASTSGLSLSAGTHTAFLAIFDTATPSDGTTKYVVASGATGLTKTIADSTASVTFASGNISSTLSNAGNWGTYGAVPEPTSGLLLLLGVAGLALKRKRA